jgi:tetraacyldisaccharide 4'-kinase
MPLSRIYALVTAARNSLYDRGILDTFSLGAKTISIGNITVGGTGKTPLVAYVARLLAESGENVCVLTRGYGRRDPEKRVLVSDKVTLVTDARVAGDEAVELGRNLLGKGMVIADANRLAAAEWALRKFGISVFVLDDGFQHRRAKRDLDIVCIDATDPFGGGRTLPHGRLREPLEGLSRADVIVITRTELVENIGELRSEIAKQNNEALVFVASTEIRRVVALKQFLADLDFKLDDDTAGQTLIDRIRRSIGNRPDQEIRIAAFCGLGNPEGFFRQVSKEKVDLVIKRSFPDHHKYVQTDIDALEKQSRQANVSALVTTAKDAVKLKGLEFSLSCFVIEIDVVIDDPAGFAALL